MISLRRQNELVKLAATYGVEELLPPSRKSKVYRETKAVEKGLRIRGTGIGQKVKGHKWERTIEGRLEDRKKAMMGMPEMIRMWKQVCSRLPGFVSLFWSPLRLARTLTNCHVAWPRKRMEEIPTEVRGCGLRICGYCLRDLFIVLRKLLGFFCFFFPFSRLPLYEYGCSIWVYCKFWVSSFPLPIFFLHFDILGIVRNRINMIYSEYLAREYQTWLLLYGFAVD